MQAVEMSVLFGKDEQALNYVRSNKVRKRQAHVETISTQFVSSGQLFWTNIHLIQ